MHNSKLSNEGANLVTNLWGDGAVAQYEARSACGGLNRLSEEMLGMADIAEQLKLRGEELESIVEPQTAAEADVIGKMLATIEAATEQAQEYERLLSAEVEEQPIKSKPQYFSEGNVIQATFGSK